MKLCLNLSVLSGALLQVLRHHTVGRPEFTVGEGCGEVFIAGDRFEVTDQVEYEGLLVLDLERLPGSPR